MMSWDKQPVLGTMGRREAVELGLQTSRVGCTAQMNLAKDRSGAMKRRFQTCIHYFFSFVILL